MIDQSCARASALAAAAAARPLGAEELAHARGCADCATELAIVASRHVSRALIATAQLRDARQTLLRARLEARRRETERRLRPLAIWQAVVLVLATASVFWLAPQLLHAGGAATPSSNWLPLPLAVLAAGAMLLAAVPVVARLRRRA